MDKSTGEIEKSTIMLGQFGMNLSVIKMTSKEKKSEKIYCI